MQSFGQVWSRSNLVRSSGVTSSARKNDSLCRIQNGRRRITAGTNALPVLRWAGLWWGSSLLVSSQAVSSLAAGILWAIDVGWRLVTGRFLVGGTEYMWDTRFPVWARLLSTFHIGLPLVLLWAMRKIGYDRRALALQAAIAAGLFIVSRFLSPELNMNYAYRDPLWHRAWGPAPLHLAVVFIGAVALLYWPTHLLLNWMFPITSVTR